MRIARRNRRIGAVLAVLAMVTVGLTAVPAVGAIVGDTEVAAPGQFESVVSLHLTPVVSGWPWPVEERFHCGGTLIAPQIVLTAGHCRSWGSALSPLATVQPPERFSIEVTQADLNAAVTTRVDVVDHVQHPVADLALFMLAEPVDVAPQILDLGVNSSYTDPNGPFSPIAVGWGVTEADGFGDPTNQLLFGEGSFGTDCSDTAAGAAGQIGLGPEYSDATNTCLDFESGGVMQCLKDSGGPILIEAAEQVQVSVMSYVIGDDGGLCANIGVQVRVAPYIEWMREMMTNWGVPTVNEDCHFVPLTSPRQRPQYNTIGEGPNGELVSCTPPTQWPKKPTSRWFGTPGNGSGATR